ncbi:hypothetical protein ACFVIY_41540 [Streptomyces sp. NPDC127166]|uniref:hypothetical protein n=1 Tax=Streptomyces sp. NPDC127166 TaxID=3345380 RepID=UPI00363F9197
MSAGRTGMLPRTETDSAAVHRWTRQADGVARRLAAESYWGSPGTDVVVCRAGGVHTLTNMSGAADPVVIHTAELDPQTTGCTQAGGQHRSPPGSTPARCGATTNFTDPDSPFAPLRGTTP